jgi:hypothetical protein
MIESKHGGRRFIFSPLEIFVTTPTLWQKYHLSTQTNPGLKSITIPTGAPREITSSIETAGREQAENACATTAND